MAKPTTTSTSAADLARLLVAVADADTVHRDTYLRRARALLADELPADRYRGMRASSTRSTTPLPAVVPPPSSRIGSSSTSSRQRPISCGRAPRRPAPLIGIGEQVYDAPAIALDPFSPGLAALAKAPDLAKTRDDAVAALTRLGGRRHPERGALRRPPHVSRRPRRGAPHGGGREARARGPSARSPSSSAWRSRRLSRARSASCNVSHRKS